MIKEILKAIYEAYAVLAICVFGPGFILLALAAFRKEKRARKDRER